MEIKVNSLNAAPMVEHTTQTAPVEGDFKFTLTSQIEESELQARLQNLMEAITMQGDKLAKKRDIRDMKKYRGLIKDFMNEIINRLRKVRKGAMFIIEAPSGTGKGTIIKEIMNK